jgi:hypothetical protein
MGNRMALLRHIQGLTRGKTADAVAASLVIGILNMQICRI